MAPPLLSIKKHRVDDQTDTDKYTRDPGHVDKADNNSFVECHALPFALRDENSVQ